MKPVGAMTLAASLLATTSAFAQVTPRLPTDGQVTQPITPQGAAPPVKSAAPKAAASGTDALLRQAATQRQRGRKDLAAQALQRALRDSPNNPVVLQRLAEYALEDGDAGQAETWLQRLRQVAGASDTRVAQLERRLKAATAPAPVLGAAPQAAPATAPSARPPQSAQVAATPPDPSGEARAAGFRALDAGDLASAERQFNLALRQRASDLEAAGGLGVVRLRQERFAEARDLLARAARGGGGAERWGTALRAAEFFARLNEVRAAYAAGRYDEAVRLGEPLANGEHPSRVEAQILLAQSLAALGRPSEAEPVYRQALLVAPGRTEVVTGLAQALAASGRYDEANRTLRDLPDNRAAGVRADIERRRALDLQRRGDTFGAGAALASALRANPSDPWTRLEYARFLLERGQTAQAAQVATPLYNASDSDSLQAAALLSEARGNPDEAATLLQRIPDANRTPEVRELAGRVEARRIIQQARLAGQQGQAPQGVAYLRDFLSRNDPPFAVRSQIAETLLDLGDVYQAGALALEAAGQPPVRFRPTEASGFLAVLAQTGQDGPALGLLQAAAQQTASPADQADYRTLAALYTARRADRLRLSGDYAAAFDALSQGFALAPRDVGLLGALARLYQSGGLPEQAAQAYDALLALSPNDPDVIRGAAQAAQAAGDHGRAERLLRRAATLRPNDAELYYQIGLLEQARGRDRSALRAFERAETLLRGGRAPGLGGGALTAPGAGVLGPNPFAPRAPVAASFPVANLAAPDVSGPALAWSATGQGTPAVQGAPYQAPPSYGAPQAYGSGAPYPQAPYVLAPQAQYAQPQYPQPQYLPGPQPQYLPGLQSQGAPAYGSSTIPANSAPYGASPPSFALPQAQPSYAGAAPSSYGAAPIPGLAASAPPAAAASLPLPTRIAREIAALRTETAPQVEGSTTFRARTGEQGTSELFEAGMRAAASVSPFGIGRLGVAVSPIIVGAGAPDEATAARIGTTPLVVAETISQGRIPTLPLEESRHEAGAAFSLFYESDPLSIDLGTTPIGFGDTRLSAGVTGRLNIGEAQIRATAEQRPVTDSLLSYAGETDRQTGVSWGGVMRQSGSLGGSLSFSSGGAYFDAIYKRLRGEAVADNTGYELNGGVYYRPIDEDGDRLQIGVNVNMQAYDKNLRFFSFGHGGYFSPQQFVAMSLPISYAQERETWRWSAGLTVGLQSYSEDSAPIFPTSSAAQAALASYGSIDASIASRYAGNDKTGVGIAGLLNGEYNLLPTTRAGGELSADTFGRYKEFRVRLYLKQIFAN